MLFCYCHDCTSNMSFFITVERVKFAQTIVNRVKIAFINSSASWVDDIYEFVTIGSENWLYATDICKSDSSDKNETFPFSLSICRDSFCCSTVESLWLRYLLMNSLPGSKLRVFLFVACTERKLLLVKLLRKLMSRTVRFKWYLICVVSERTEHIQDIKYVVFYHLHQLSWCLSKSVLFW